MTTRQCAILVGGTGSRLGPLTKLTPKPLLPVGGRPFLEVLLRELGRRGFDDIVLLAGHAAPAVETYVEESRIADEVGARIRVVVEPHPMGTGGALVHAQALLEDSFLVMNGDTWFDFNWLDFVVRAEAANGEMAMALRAVPSADRYETVVVDGSRVTSIRPRGAFPGPALINGGVYWLRKSVLRGQILPLSMESDVLPRIAKAGSLVGWSYDSFFLDIGVPDDYGASQHLVPARQRRPAAFLDRDGVLNFDTGYVHRPDEISWIPGAKEAVKRLNDLGYYTFVVTNQAGVAHGYYEEAAILELHSWMAGQLREVGAHIDDWRYCVFHPEGKLAQFRRAHAWRKPEPGMIIDLMSKWPIDETRSFLVGDKDSDLEAARAAGVAGFRFDGENLADFVAKSLRGNNTA